MENYDTIFYKETAKISSLSSSRIDKYEYLTGKGILPSNQIQMMNKLDSHILP